MNQIIILMGSQSDMEIMKKAQTFLDEQQIPNQVFVASAHRTPEKLHQIIADNDATTAIYIAGAGMAAHLPGVVASLTEKPVIGVPINATLNGLDALLAIVQMPPGIPVATVAINGAKNAAILALEILALSEPEAKKALTNFRQSFKK